MTLAVTVLVIVLMIGAFCGLMSLIDWKVQATKRIRREEERAAAEAERLQREAERLEAQKPYNEKALAWVRARKMEGEPHMTYGEFGRLWGYPIDTLEEYEAFRQSAFANAIELQPSRQWGGAYEYIEEIQQMHRRIACPNCFQIYVHTVGVTSGCPYCGTRSTGPK